MNDQDEWSRGNRRQIGGVIIGAWILLLIVAASLIVKVFL